MNSNTNQTHLPNSAAQLQQYLRSLIAENFTGDFQDRTHDADKRWDTVILGLSDNFCASFPLPGSFPWNALKEKISILDTALELIHLASLHVEGIFSGKQDGVGVLVVRLLNICVGLDVWLDTKVEVEDGLPSPATLKEKAFKALVSVVRSLGGSITRVGQPDEPRWKILRGLLSECIELVSDILSNATSITLPVVIPFFKRPRLREKPVSLFDVDSRDKSMELSIATFSQLASLLALLLDTLTHTLYPPVLAQWFLSDMTLGLHKAFNSLFNYLLSTACPFNSTARVKVFVTLISSATLFCEYPAFAEQFSLLTFRLLQFRVLQDSESVCNEFNLVLLKAIDLQSKVPLSEAAAKEVVRLLCAEASEQLSNLFSAYLRALLPQASEKLLCHIRQALSADDSSKFRFKELLSQVEQYDGRAREMRLDVQAQPPPPSLANWRQRVRVSISSIVDSRHYSWTEISDVSDNQYALYNLRQINDYFKGGYFQASQAPKDGVVEKLSNFVSVVTRCDDVQCTGGTRRIDVFALSDIMQLIFRGPGQVTVTDRRRAYDTIRHGIRHHSDDTSVHEWNRAGELVFKGIVDKDRSVRLAAGRALNALLEATSSGDSTAAAAEMLERLYGLLESAKMPIKETLIITLGSCGETQNSSLLGQIICFLIAQLGRPNPVIQGLAHVKFLSIVKKHNKTPFSMVQPYLDQVAPFLFSRMCSQPALFEEACRAMATPPSQFIRSNLSRALPQLFAQCEKAVLEAVSKELGKKPSILFLNHSHTILAHVFLQQDQTKKALQFILKTLEAGSQGASIDIVSVIKSCLVPLLTELVINLGDDNSKNAKLALQEVQGYLMLRPTKGRSLPVPDLGAFLKTYILGIVSGISDMLQGVQGKKSIEVKKKIVRSIGSLVTFIGGSINIVGPQIMAIFQTMITIPELSDSTVDSWDRFMSVLGPGELGPYIGPTSAAFVACWPNLNPYARELAGQILSNIVMGFGAELGTQLHEIADLSGIGDLEYIHDRIQELRSGWTPMRRLKRILQQSTNDNLTVSTASLSELKEFMLSQQRQLLVELTSGDIFDPMVGKILEVLFSAASRGGDASQQLRLLAFECIGILGAVDPDRFEGAADVSAAVILSNFTDENESMSFAVHLISDLLVGAFRSTSDMAYQTRLAYVIQELLKFCQFTPALVAVGNSGGSVPLRVRQRWNQLPKVVLETVSPLLEARYAIRPHAPQKTQTPVYPHQSTYRDWIQTWTVHLINRVSGETVQKIFSIFRSIVRHQDVVVAHHILPHLVLHVLVSGNDEDLADIRKEFLIVLEDQVDSTSGSISDKKLLCAQAVFMLFDHLNKWVRIIRQGINAKKNETKRARANQIYNQAEEQLLRVDSLLTSIDQHLIARAAFQCKAYARSLMNYESQILAAQQRSPSNKDLPNYYEKLHEIYAHLDEPDGMEGVSTLILAPSLEHQIRQHENTGHWTSAQSCWELRLRKSPDNIEYHLGLLRCLRNLGHYDSLRTHVRGILTRNPEWGNALIGYELESAWMVGAWSDVKVMVERAPGETEQVAMARVLLAMRSGDQDATSEALRAARNILGAPIAAAGITGYRRAYEAVLNLHLMHELEAIHNAVTRFPTDSQPGSQTQRRQVLTIVSQKLATRLDATLPTFRTREPILSMRRTAFALTPTPRRMLMREASRSWIASAKIARKAGQWQTAYSSMLQAQQGASDIAFLESAKVVKARGEARQALRELENSMRLLGHIPDDSDVLDLTADDESKAIKAKAQILRARWMHETERFELSHIHKIFSEAAEILPAWESGHFRLGQFHDECFKALPPGDKSARGLKMNVSTVKAYAKAIRVGSKYVYQTVPRLLTIWLDLAEDEEAIKRDNFKRLNDVVAKVINDSPPYKWYTAFPQIVSRIGISNAEAYKHLSKLISRVIEEYPKQALWLFTSVVKSTKDNRSERGRQILNQLRNNPSEARKHLAKLINQSINMTNELLALCNHRIDDDRRQLSMYKGFPKLAALGKSDLIIPLQESLTANLPPTSALESSHQPFPSDAPTFDGFSEEIDIMRSLAKPRKITIRGSDGEIYMFLGKPKDDLRKDARIMDFNSIINKLLKANSESRRRQLHIRTYGIVTLNEECGFIQWVPNTIPMRPVLLKHYDTRGIKSWSGEMNEMFRRIKEATDKEAGVIFSTEILPLFPPLFHEWFIETFPEPSAWLTSRLTYSRTAAVTSMVGFILGLGDRHCENILLDTNTGDIVHVDFNCLFERGKTLDTPERVPFRLTQNMVDGLGVTGTEGVFRIACEVTLQLLRDNKDSLMNVLDAFLHDPLVEWEDEKRKLEREPAKRNQVKSAVGLGMLARNALEPIQKKLNGVHKLNKERVEKEVSTSTLVQILIQEATDSGNLAKMYPGWASWH